MTKPLTGIWVRWCPTIYDWRKYHLFDAETAFLYGWRHKGTECSTTISSNIYEIEITADTPDRKDCCKKCLKKVKDENNNRPR